VVPKLPILKVIDDWEKIKYYLMENPRKRGIKSEL